MVLVVQDSNDSKPPTAPSKSKHIREQEQVQCQRERKDQGLSQAKPQFPPVTTLSPSQLHWPNKFMFLSLWDKNLSTTFSHACWVPQFFRICRQSSQDISLKGLLFPGFKGHTKLLATAPSCSRPTPPEGALTRL